VSFEVPEYTANSDAIGTLRILEAIRILGLEKKTRFYQAPLPNYTGWYKKPHKAKPRRFIRAHPMRSPSCTLIGLPSITVKPTGCLPVTGYCSIMNRPCAGKPL